MVRKKEGKSEGMDLGEVNMTPVIKTEELAAHLESIAVPFQIEDPVDFAPPQLKIFAARGATVPKKATKGSAGADISACLAPGDVVKAMSHLGETVLTVRKDGTLVIPAGYRVLVPTGLFMDIPNFTMVQIYPRSGTSFKKGLILTNSVAVIDSDYVEEVFVSLTNVSGQNQTITMGERIAQIVLVYLDSYEDIVALPLPPQRKTERAGGFGSTGV